MLLMELERLQVYVDHGDNHSICHGRTLLLRITDICGNSVISQQMGTLYVSCRSTAQAA